MLMRRRFFLAGAAGGLVAGSAVRRPAHAQAGGSGPSEPIEALHQGLLAIMRAGRATPFPRRFRMLQPVVERVFDLPAILRACVGPRWASLPPPDQEKLLELFETFTVASYVANFRDFAGQRFEILPGTRAVGEDQVVSTRIVPASGDPTRIDYVMHQDGSGGWRVVDVLLDGTISRVAVQRSDFRSLLERGQAGSGLIVGLQKKIADLSRGTLPTQ